MLRKLFALVGGLILALAGVAISPAEADEIAAHIAATVLDQDGRVDHNTGTCNTKATWYGGDGTNNATVTPARPGRSMSSI